MGLLSLFMIYVVYSFIVRDVGLDKKIGVNSSIVTFIPLGTIVAD